VPAEGTSAVVYKDLSHKAILTFIRVVVWLNYSLGWQLLGIFATAFEQNPML
jgi:hypothetical protein